MNAYRNETFARRSVFAFAALALTVATFAIAIGLPAEHAPARANAATTAASASAARPVEVLISPARIDVIGQRTHETAQDEPREIRPHRRG